jgi:excisionase family DNA binding protein
MSPRDAEPLVYTVIEAAKQLRISRALLYQLLKSGVVRSFWIGRCRRIRAEDLQEYLARQVNTANPPL